ncbi:MAG: hypothetical protein ACT4TC_20150 [Myxococcaceae bacterium]
MDLGRRASFLLPLSLVGCSGKPSSPEAAAEAFVDRYYVEKNHAKALELSEDVAAKRVVEEQKLRQEAGGPDGAPQPRVFYKQLRKTDRAEDTELVYSMTIDASGMKLRKDVRLVVKPVDKTFKVVSFTESDVAP